METKLKSKDNLDWLLLEFEKRIDAEIYKLEISAPYYKNGLLRAKNILREIIKENEKTNT